MARRKRKTSHPYRDVRKAWTQWKVERARNLKTRNQQRAARDKAKATRKRERAVAAARRERLRKDRMERAERRQQSHVPVVVRVQPGAPTRKATAPRAAAPRKTGGQRAIGAGRCGEATLEDGTPCQRRGKCPPGTHR